MSETKNEPALTQAQFSQQAAFIASKAASWAGDLLALPERHHQPARLESVKRFVEDIRDHCDIIERWAEGKDLCGDTTPEPSP